VKDMPPRHKRYRTLREGEGYVTCPVQRERIVRGFIDWLTEQQKNVVSVRDGVEFYRPTTECNTKDSLIGKWVRKHNRKGKRRPRNAKH